MKIMICRIKEVKLAPEQKIDLEALHDTSRDKRVCDRIKVVLLRSEGWTTAMVTQALRLHETTILDILMIIFIKKNDNLPMAATNHI
jgi:hypothetical protein